MWNRSWVLGHISSCYLTKTDTKKISSSSNSSGIPAYYKELFGPVASFYRVKDDQAAIDLANDSPFGLGGSVFTQDIERGKLIADQTDTGMVFINHPTWTQEDLPYGGTKGSGYGRELSELGIDEFVNKKLIRVSELNDPF